MTVRAVVAAAAAGRRTTSLTTNNMKRRMITTTVASASATAAATAGTSSSTVSRNNSNVSFSSCSSCSSFRRTKRSSSSSSSILRYYLHNNNSNVAAAAAAAVGEMMSLSSSSSSSPFSSYEYPHATEVPVVSRTTAAEAAAAAAAAAKDDDDKEKKNGTASSSSSSSLSSLSLSSSWWKDHSTNLTSVVNDGTDHFDDGGTMKQDDIDTVRRRQRERLSTTPAGCTAIGAAVPAHVPPNVPASQLREPATELTVLDNGVRVVSQETYGQVSTVGVCCSVGSRTETAEQTGVCHLLEVLAFGETAGRTGLQVSELLNGWGGTRFANTAREQSLYCVDLLRPNVPGAVSVLLRECLLQPAFPAREVEDAKRALEYQAVEMPADLMLGEALQAAAYGPLPPPSPSPQQLGKPHFCGGAGTAAAAASADAAAHRRLSADAVKQYWESHFVSNPAGIVIGGAGVHHDQLVELADANFGHLRQLSDERANRVAVRPSVYTGGEQFVVPPTTAQEAAAAVLSSDAAAAGAGAGGAAGAGAGAGDPAATVMLSPAAAEERQHVRVAVAFEVGGWHSADLVAVCVLQTLLGGGNAFSAGGPGKGMYSRLYRQVLNRYGWAESAESFTSFASESGLWGISACTRDAAKSRDMVQVLADHMARLAVEPVTDEELDRARNMLKCNVLIQLESRLVLFEDLARQVLTYGHREDTHTTCQRIEAVTKEDLQRIAAAALQTPPTVAAVGADLSQVPKQEEVAMWFGTLQKSSSSSSSPPPPPPSSSSNKGGNY